jgi:hypothetical protein
MLVVVADGDAWATVPIDEVHDGGRVVVALGRRFVLNRLTGQYVQEGQPYWGSRLQFAPVD